MADTPQTYETHARIVPLYHYVATPILLINFLNTVRLLWQAPGVSNGIAVLTAFALIVIAVAGRVFALKAQDRVIRLEERMRMRELFTGDLKARINDFTPAQLVGLRFASDAELPELSATVLRDNIQNADAIKKMIKNWRADHLRV